MNGDYVVPEGIEVTITEVRTANWKFPSLLTEQSEWNVTANMIIDGTLTLLDSRTTAVRGTTIGSSLVFHY